MEDKDKKISFLTGMIVGIFLTFVFMGIAVIIYKLGSRIVDSVTESHLQKKTNLRIIPQGTAPHVKEKKFKINFENKEDMEFFEKNDGLYIERTKDHATDGQFALLAEYPKGAKYPGLMWEVYGKDRILNWNGAANFMFDVYNNSEVDAVLVIKFKSGPDEPKKVYQTYATIPTQQSKKIVIPIEELRNNLDVGEISYINLFINEPHENITLYFDNIRTE